MNLKRWPIIRHVRYYWHGWRIYRLAEKWEQVGIGTGVPNHKDLVRLEMIYRGEA